MSTPPRGSAAQVNMIFKDALERAKVIIDDLAKIVGASGYPPLTQPVTLRDLQQMQPQDAVAFLRSELQRTMQTDPLTQDKKPNPKTVELAVTYLEQQRGITNGR